MSKPDWTKAPDGATHYSERGYMRWYKCENGGVCGYSDKRWVPLPLDVFSEKDKEALMEKPKQWRGPEDGLPPIGAECEVFHNDEWIKCEIIGHFKQPAGMCVAFVYGYDEKFGIRDIDYYMPDAFRTLRTEEDKVVEEWCAVIDDAISKYNINIDCSAAIKATIVESYRAGYRKQDASE